MSVWRSALVDAEGCYEPRVSPEATGRAGSALRGFPIRKGGDVPFMATTTIIPPPSWMAKGCWPGVSVWPGHAEAHARQMSRIGHRCLWGYPCGCPILCRGWSGSLFVFVDETLAAGRSNKLKGR